jgi:hypothetical protein
LPCLASPGKTFKCTATGVQGLAGGKDPCAADLSACHPIWFARQNGGPEIAELISFPSVFDPWYQRVAAIGHGEHNDMTPEEAIEVAKVNQPKEPDGWSPEAHELGFQRGDWVSVTPDDYGNPVHGNILAWTAGEIVIRHEDPSVGKVNVHFPRVGFDVAPAERLSTKSRESIYGTTIRMSAERAKEARKEADRLACVALESPHVGLQGTSAALADPR